jgi:hypothetical protein
LSPSSAFISLFLHSKLNGLVIIPTVKIHIPLAIFAITGAAHVPVPPHIPQVINTISVSCKTDLISISLSSADFLPISGFAQAQRPFVKFSPIFTFVSARLLAKSCASVLIATNQTPSKPSVIILSNALFPQPPIPKILIFAPGMNSGFISWITIILIIKN